jgi:hypothetical protein
MYNSADDETALAELDTIVPEQNSMVPSAAGHSSEVAPAGGYDKTGGYTEQHFLASGYYFAFNGEDQITFTINSSASKPVLDPPEKLIITIAEPVGTAPAVSTAA